MNFLYRLIRGRRLREIRRFDARTRRAVSQIPDPAARAADVPERRRAVEVKTRDIEREQLEVQEPLNKDRSIAQSQWAGEGGPNMGLALFCFVVDVVSWAVSVLKRTHASLVVAVAAGIMLASVLAWGFHAIFGRLFHDALRPQRVVRRHQVVGWCAIALAIGSFITLLTIVPSLEASLAIALGSACFVGFNVGFPVGAGAFSSLSMYLGRHEWNTRYAQDLAEALVHLQELGEWLEAQTRLEETQAPAPSSSVPSSPSRRAPPAGSLPAPVVPGSKMLNVIGLCALLGASGAIAGNTDPAFANPTARARPGTIPTTAAGSVPPCAFFDDGSGSRDQKERRSASAFVVESLEEIVGNAQCRQIVVGVYSGRGRWTPRRVLRVPDPPAPQDCTKVEPEEPEGVGGILFGLFANVHDGLTSAEQKKCADQNVRLLDRYRADFETLRDQLRAAFSESPPPGEDKSTRTWDLLEGLAHARGTSLAVFTTDALDTPRGPVVHVVLPPGMRVVMIVTSPVQPYGTRSESLSKAREWERAFPGLVAVPLPELYPGFWRDFFRKGGRS